MFRDFILSLTRSKEKYVGRYWGTEVRLWEFGKLAMRV